MRRKILAVGAWLAVALIAAGISPARGRAAGRRHAIPVGWHDEMDDPATWKPREGGMPPDIFARRPGVLTLRLAHVPEGYPFSYQWGGVTRSASVDLGRYPVLAAHFPRVQSGSYCHLDVEQLDYSGRPVHTLRTPTLQGPGLSVLDLGKEYGTYVRRLVLRINAGGALTGAECDCGWVRFVRREDLPLLQEAPDWQAVELKP
ncbi:MAG TPA: hypothetical protein VFU47_00460 [Armatimonadota bacterium]|nr:hypothetical protein [Armatimonadota bacterium]